MKTKKGSPSGVGCRMYAATKSKPISLTGIGFSQFILRLLMVLLVLPMAWMNAWAGSLLGGSAKIQLTTSATGQGLVYHNKNSNSNPGVSSYSNLSPSSATEIGKQAGPHTSYGWAMPARGYVFSGWSGYQTQTSSKEGTASGQVEPCNTEAIRAQWDGVADPIQNSAGGSTGVTTTVTAQFAPLTPYSVTYAIPVGGSYSVNYSYYLTRVKSGTTYEFYTAIEDYSLSPSSEEPEVVNSYSADVITLTTPTTATNFIGWYEGDSFLGMGTGSNHSYTYEAHATGVTVSAQFKELAWGDASGDLSVDVTAKGEHGPKTVYIAIPTMIGNWSASDFEIEPMSSSNEYGSITIGTISLDKTNNRLVIPYTYSATDWGGISVDVTVTPAYGESKQFTIAAYAEEVVDYEACIEENSVRTYTGTLAAMMTQVNSMDNKPTLKLMQNKTITAPLSFTQSFTFDVNGRVLTANCASAFSIDATGIDVQIIDSSFTQVGEIHTSYASAYPVSVVTFTQAAKLTMQGGTLSAENTGSGSAYGVDVQQGSIFYMTGGDLTVTASSGDARGANIATASDYATFNGGSIAVSAPTNAYGLWSAGQSNITNTMITVETTTEADAYGAYVNGGVSTITTTDITTNAKTANAYGAYVNAGRLNFNGGKLDVSAETSNVYGVHVASGATVMMQQKSVVKAEATGASGTNVVGINNLGTASLNNITVTATSPTNNAKAINTAASAISTTIEDGTYTANAETGTAYGIHHQYGKLNADGVTFKGIVKASGTEAYGVCAAADAKISNATLLGETRGSATTAYGFKGDAVGAIDTLSNCTITGLSNKSKAYSIYTKANVAAINCTLAATTLGSDNANDGAEAYGVYAENGTNAIANCSATVTSNTIKAYGVNHVAGSLTLTEGTYIVKANQATAPSDESSNLYGLYNATGVTSTVNGAEFQVTAMNDARAQYVYGAYINGTLNSTGATYNVTARRYVYGLQGVGGSSNLVLANNTIRVEATNTTTANSNSSYCYGIYANKNFTINGDKVDATGHIKDVYAMYFVSASNGDVLGGKFSAQANGTNNYGCVNATGTKGSVRLKGGVYKTAINLQKYVYTGYQIYHMDGSHPDYADGYRYTIATENPSPYVCHIVGGAYYATLKEALQYTLDNSGTYTIVMTQPHTLLAGEYVLPANATLIVPRKFGQTTITGTGDPATVDKITTVGLNENFLCLTMASGAHLNVDGKIGVSGEMYSTQSGGVYNNSPYGRIQMESGSHIQLNSGAYLYAWGMITGSGSITVKNNAEVREMFQVKNMPSASNMRYYINEYDASNTTRFMPFNQYVIQNIEVPTTYYYNSRLITEMRCYYEGADFWYGDGNIKLVGTSGALFEVTSNDESSWVRKSYDATGKQQVWEVNSSVQLGSISISMKLPIINTNITINSAHYILPVTNNMKIHVMDGDFAITNDTELMPGASVEINKTASLTVNSGKKLYVFDKDQWSSTTSYADAAINVHGNINVKGALYTTSAIAGGTNATHGANIYSNNADAGTIFFENAAPSATTSIELITGVENSSIVTKTVTMDPALLKNGAGANQAFTPTSGTDEEHSFAYMNNEWQETYTDGCFEVKGGHTYAKPSDYVELKKQRDQKGSYDDLFILDNHTYLSIDETRIFIHLLDAEGDCQWWEVTQVGTSDVYYCATNGIYYQYQYDEEFHEWYWREKGVTVTFYSDEEGTTPLKVITTNYMGIPDQAVIASNPTKATTTGYTYQFYGWQSSVEPYKTYPWTATLEEAEDDMYYLPVFTATPRNYTVTFINANNGANVPVETAYNTHPVCTPAPTKAATAQYTYFFQYWLASDNTTQYAIDDELPAVTGATSYTAVWSSVENRYTITWKDGETVLETDKHLLYGATTSFDGTLPTKEPDDNFVYAFSGWRSSLTGQTYANGSTPTVAGETTYEAQFSTTPRYKVTFANYDGSELYHEFVTQGEHPIYNGLTPGRTRDLDGYFRFIGWKNSDGTDFAPNATLPGVTGKETYTAQYDYVTELYLITLNNVDGAGASWSGKFGVGSTPFYNKENDDVAVEPSKASTEQYEYTFSGWDPALVPVEGEATYTAQFEQYTRKYNITFANLDGNGAQQTIEVEYGTEPICPVTPEKVVDHTTSAFEGWSPAITNVTGNQTYTAQFSSTGTVETFPITFDLDNGSAPVVVNIEYGTTPSWTGVTPTKLATAQYTYTFAGWYPEFAPVTGEETYIAQYTQTLNSYTIRFVNYDGTELQSSELAYGVLPTYSSSAPQKTADLVNMKAYNFSGWSPAIATVTGAATYTAQFNEVDVVASVTTESDETTYYGSWSSALAAANSSANCTLKLYANVTPNINTEINQRMTIDLNGCLMSNTTSQTGSGQNRLLAVYEALTIVDSKGGGKISFSGSGNTNYNAIAILDDAASLTLNSGTIESKGTANNGNCKGYAIIQNYGAVYINGGELISSSRGTSASTYAIYNNNKSVTITGGKLKVTINSSTTSNSANMFYRPAYVTATGGYYTKDPTNNITIPDGYEKLTISEDGYIRKVAPKTNINYTVKHFKQNLENNDYTEVTADHETKQGTTATATAAEAKNYEGFTALPFEQGTIAGNGSTVVNIYYDRNTYTIIWKNGETILETDENVKYGTMPSYDGATPTKANSETQTFVFSGWSPEVAEVNGDVTYYAQFKAFDLNLVVDEADEIDASISVTTTTVTVSGTLEIDPGVTLTTTNLILEASESGSGQILDGGTINATNVYYDLTLNTAARHWHAFGVPWNVDVTEHALTEVETGRTLVVGRDCEIIYYNGATRASQGPGAHCWDYLKHYSEAGQPVEVMTPGKGYMIAFTSAVRTVRFTKASGAPIIFDGSNSVTGGDGEDGGWNAIANPMAYHATLNAGPTVGYVHDGGEIGSDGYTPYDINAKKYIVGKTVYVQAGSDQTIVVNPAGSAGEMTVVSAPRRASKATDKQYLSLSDYYAVSLSNGEQVSKVYVLPEEGKTDQYVIGHDLSQFSMSTKKAQIWVDRYENKLALNTTAPIADVAYFPVSLYAAVAGEYTITNTFVPNDDYTVYLTLDGNAIWNLSDAPHTITLDNGTTKGYGLRLSRKAPQTPTGIDEALIDAQGETRKVIIEDKVFIIRGEKVYSVDGQLVK